MPTRLDITNKRFGHLVAMWPVGFRYVGKWKRPNGRIHKQLNTYWLCCCDCGRLKVVFQTNLTVRETKSCGLCGFQQSRAKICNTKYKQGVGTVEYNMWRGARTRAKLKNLPIDITPEDIYVPDLCPFLGIPLIKNSNVSSPNSPSLDRLDSTKGYTKDNILVVSHKANTMKSDSTISAFEGMAVAWRKMIEAQA